MSRPSTSRVIFRLLRSDWRSYVLAWFQWLCFHAAPLPVGWVLKLILDRLTDGSPGLPVVLLATLLGLEVARWSLFVSAAFQWHGAWVGWLTVPRVNVLSSLATGTGPAAGRLPGSSGEAVSRFRDDAQDLGLVLDVWLDVSASLLTSIVALTVIASIDRTAAVSVAVPVALALGLSAWLGPSLRRWRRAAREATAAVTSFIGDTFGSILAVKAGGAERAVDNAFTTLNLHRAKVSRTDQLGSELIRSLGYGTGEITIGVVLVLVAGAFQRGELSVGDIGLFASYVTVVASLPKWVGRLGAYQRQADVSVDRLGELMDGDRAAPVQQVTTYLRHGPPVPEHQPLVSDGLRQLDVRGLTVRHPTSGRGVEDVDLTVRGGELVVITGVVGAGKSTLLRGLLGLVTPLAGEVRWNGSVVADPSTFLVPPRVSYLPQVPRLFSETLSETILLGLPPDQLEDALWLACLEEDLQRMPAGADTLIGPRGLRLSGGQVQRAGAARALVRRPDLLVVDDLSSALDVETEMRLWERLRTAGTRTALLVSHRPHVLAIADRVIVLHEGRVVSDG
ncbi:MAG: Heterodimeric efflux ABC transporter, permease/ATP-binding subunit 2 [uncultured Acidimicrobiales bacterium]|uniref:Heterodimeric efflux ABC transporter, permease/ATP-binding subunit 2 n=1 Tax=uncultured Acidimicrobiales bacterium TaxID=310071 RepID=A0A6J4I8X5_9ACTN|nr:MAG: Heterodimeric efflux ABC transporter, permease/ATP-binding subunit 2 [uncultured Acidimicrobiales bacterium]